MCGCTKGEKNEAIMQSSLRKILIIDDDNRNTFALKAVLKVKGYDCVSANDAHVGLRHLAENSEIGMVFMDMMMPEMDGYETMRIIRQGSAKEIPLIAVTAQAMPGDREKCLEAGADGYLSKPIDVDALLALIRLHLR